MVYILFLVKYKKYFQFFLKNDYFDNLVKFIIIISIGLSYIFFLLFFYVYYHYYGVDLGFLLTNIFYVTPTIDVLFLYFLNFEFCLDFFGLILLHLAYVAGILSLIVLDTRVIYRNIKFLNYINIFTLFVFFFVFSNNILLLFLFYEFLLLPSVLLVYFVSPSRRAIQATLYFIIWTQIGSFLVLCVISYIISVCGSSYFNTIKFYYFTYDEAYYIFLFLFLGFGFKVPIWPFHYWLTKTHVEAPSGFSMYLSGFLVKTALYGFYKISNLVGYRVDTTLFVVICIVGVFDSSLKMWGQTDLKKLVAYGTIQEMNIIYLAFCWGNSLAVIGGILFCITHAALSTLMFYIVDCLQRRFNSRNVSEISGVLQLTPNLGIAIIVMCILYSGLPGTLKFTCECFIFIGLLETSIPFTCFLIFVANVIGLVGFCKCWFNVLFGINIKYSYIRVYDLSFKEVLVLIIPVLYLIFATIVVDYFF
jgi:NADH-quinone oxidoreductase subunit M